MQGAWIEIEIFRNFSFPIPSLPVQGAWIEIFSSSGCSLTTASLPVQGAWIEIVKSLVCQIQRPGRSPCRERGLKSKTFALVVTRARPSLPVQGAWIEMASRRVMRSAFSSLPVQGAWIEMPTTPAAPADDTRRSPCRERGLKLC